MKTSSYLHRFFVAFQFLTIIPLGKGLQVDEVVLGKSGSFFPSVGLIIGLILIACYKLVLMMFPIAISDLFVLLTLVVLTGALHIDGFCDTVDALASRKDRATTLEIMRDSRLGAMGAIGLFFLLALKYLTFTNLAQEIKYSLLILMPTLGRYSIIQLAFFFPYGRTGPGKGRPFSDYLEGKDMLIALTQTLLVSLVIMQFRGIIILLLIILATIGWGIYVRQRIGGVTGDIMGATNEMNELLVLLLGLVLA
jgi:adenosylcobinamide-GDP ribazoletransferase